MVSYGRSSTLVTALDELVCALRAVVDRHDWRTARLVARTLERHLPSPEVLTDEQRAGDADGYRSYHCNERAISIHVCGTDVSRTGSSVHRYYDHPVLCD